MKRRSAHANNNKAATTSPLPLATIMDDDDLVWTQVGRQSRKAVEHPRELGGIAAGVVASGLRSSSPVYEQPVADPYITPVRSKSPGERNNTTGVDVGTVGDASTALDSGNRKRKRTSLGGESSSV